MTTRSIVTSHPDVACDVCGRRLLRGERPDVFLAGGHRRTVCELCVSRAAAEGWLREADSHSLGGRAPRGRRARSLFGRLRQLGEPSSSHTPAQARAARSSASEDALDSELYEFLDAVEERAHDELSPDYDAQLEPATEHELDGGDYALLQPEPANGATSVARALQVFNAGEQPRRVAGVARSLGAPAVAARAVDETGARIAIVVAWELCWYRYEVDLNDEPAGAQLLDRGTELQELAPEDRLANAVADERGELAPLG